VIIHFYILLSSTYLDHISDKTADIPITQHFFILSPHMNNLYGGMRIRDGHGLEVHEWGMIFLLRRIW